MRDRGNHAVHLGADRDGRSRRHCPQHLAGDQPVLADRLRQRLVRRTGALNEQPGQDV